MATLPRGVTDLVGQTVLWYEDRVTVVEGEATTKPSTDGGLVLGARWARDTEARPVGEAHGLVQYLMERPDGTTRWTSPVAVP